jgi:adenosylcobinamide-GDP ribazoletransferase
MRTFLDAVSFLTILPATGKDPRPGRAAILFPLLGAILGAAGAALFIAMSPILSPSIAALIAVAFWTLIAGVLHEEGSLGIYAYVAIVLSVAAKWQALVQIPSPRILEVCIIAQTVPRTAIVALAWLSRPSVGRVGYEFSASLGTTGSLLAIAQGLVASMLLGWHPGLLILTGTYLIARAVRTWFYKRVGGVNADALGLTAQLLEIFILVLFAGWPAISA